MTPSCREARDVVRGEALGVLDALAQPARRPGVACRLEGVERVAVGAVADRVHGDRPAGPAAARRLLELLAARDPYARAVEHQRRLRAEVPSMNVFR